MSGIINQTGSRSGTIGRTEGGFTKILVGSSLSYAGSVGEFYQVFTKEFGQYHVVLSNVTGTNDNVQLNMRLLNTSDGVHSTSDYRQSSGGSYNSSSATGNDETRGRWDGNSWNITPAGDNIGDIGSGEGGMNATLTFYNPLSTKFYTYVAGHVSMLQEGGTSVRTSIFSGIYLHPDPAAGFKLYFDTGSISQGQVSVYGMGLPDLA